MNEFNEFYCLKVWKPEVGDFRWGRVPFGVWYAHIFTTLGRWAHLDVVRFWDILVTSDWVVASDRVYVDYYKKCRLVQDLSRYRVYTETTIIVTTK